MGEALDALFSKNQLQGVKSSKTNEEVEAWQQLTINHLPVILVLHLKCFEYTSRCLKKIMKAFEFPIDLEIEERKLWFWYC